MGRAEAAYSSYMKDKKYHQALRIFNANMVVYELLEEFINECDEDEIELVHHYIFHLDDWFHQFEELQNTISDLEAEFVFYKLKSGLAFPKAFTPLKS